MELEEAAAAWIQLEEQPMKADILDFFFFRIQIYLGRCFLSTFVRRFKITPRDLRTPFSGQVATLRC